MVITLTTDFGLTDPFVGIMKGVVLGIAPRALLVDITHGIKPFDVLEGSFVIHSAWRWFPAGTVHLVVVDPGVGSRRRALAVAAGGHYFVGPDNGVLSLVLERTASGPSPVVHEIRNEDLLRQPVSATFHGRDVFAPVAAHLAAGIPIDHVGPRVLDAVEHVAPGPQSLEIGLLRAAVLRIDKFGNLVTNLKREHLAPPFAIRIAGFEIDRLRRTYSEALAGEVFAIEGSSGYIELSVNQGSAEQRLGVQAGAEFEVESRYANQ